MNLSFYKISLINNVTKIIPCDVGISNCAPWIPCTSWPEAKMNWGIAAGWGAVNNCGCAEERRGELFAHDVGTVPDKKKIGEKCVLGLSSKMMRLLQYINNLQF